MYCNRCGKPIPDGSTFCNACGAPQGQSTQQVQRQPVQQRPPQKQKMSPILIIGALFFGGIVLLIILFGNNDSKGNNTSSKSITDTTQATTQITTQKPTGADPTVIIAGYSKSLDESGAPILTIYYDFTNTTGKETSFGDCFADNVRQSGKPLWSVKYEDEEAFSRKIKAGETIKIGVLYSINDEYDTSPITVELTDLFGKKTYLTEELK